MANGSHGAQRRDVERLGGGWYVQPGKFGRMFPHLTTYVDAPAAAMADLAAAMVDVAPGSPGARPDNQDVPAGYTYLGQFVDHDLTFDTTALSEVKVDPTAIFNFRTPKLELDSLYGTGPGGMPHLFEKGGPKFVLGNTTALPAGAPAPGAPLPAVPGFDLPRLSQGLAVIGDPRNDENLLVQQTHLAFMRFHNAAVDRLRADGTPDRILFEEARREVRWHYQWIVLFDMLKRMIDLNELLHVLKNGREWFTPCCGNDPYMPVEFAGAAYRLGHSMVRERYTHNRIFDTPAPFDQFFLFTGKSGIIGAGLPTFPSNWIIDWRRFFPGVTPTRNALDNVPIPALPAGKLNFARPFDPYLVPALHALPGPPAGSNEARLAFLNLMRGVRLQLPSGQAVARTLGLPELTPAQMTAPATSTPAEIAALTTHGFDRETPLWYYILKEAQLLGGALDSASPPARGSTLGPVGSRILAEVFVGLLDEDPDSFLMQHPKWSPTFGTVDMQDMLDPTRTVKRFTMADMLNFVEVEEAKTAGSAPSFINPLG
jgi:hypothetical protein